MKKLWMLLIAIGFVAGLASSAKADEVSDLRKMMEQQYEQMRQMQNRLIALEQAQTEQGQTIQKIEKTGMSLPDTLEWIERISFYGDFRFRFEHYDVSSDTYSDRTRDRGRFRLRLGMKAKINDEFALDVRLATGGSSPTSTNQSMGDGFTTKDIGVDRAVLTYTPNCLDGWTFMAGKMGNPFFRPGGSQLILDGDVTPEGVAAHYENALNDSTELFANGGGFWVVERWDADTGDNADTSLFAGQVGLKHDLGDGSLTWGGGYWCWHNIDGKGFVGGTQGGNTDGGSSTYMYGYKIAQLFGQYDTKLGDVPVSIYGDYVKNTASSVSGDTGWLVGLKYNKAKAPGTWGLGYEYRELEKDCVVGALTDADPFDGGTNGKGHKFTAQYALAKNTTLAAAYWLTDRDGDGDGKRDDNYEKMQFDVVVKF